MQWRPKKVISLFSKEQNVSLNIENSYAISPAGETSTNTSEALTLYPIGSHDNLYFFDQFYMAMGHGFSSFVDKFISTNDQGLVAGIGGIGALHGKWEFKIEDGTDPLVRKAYFTPDGHSQPDDIVNNSGTIQCNGMKFAANGTYIVVAVQYKAEFQLLELKTFSPSNADFESTYSDATNQLTAESLPKGHSWIDDRRTDKL